jgi:hypothetical protein
LHAAAMPYAIERLDITPVISKRFPARNPMMVSKKVV